MKLLLHPFTLKLNKVFKIARDSYDARKSVIVELQHLGYRGFGEAGEHSFYKVTQSQLLRGLEYIRPLIEEIENFHPEEIYPQFEKQLHTNKFALSALDIALWDLYGKINNKSVNQLLDLPNPKEMPLTSYTIGIESADQFRKDLQSHQYSLYKIKLGTSGDLGTINIMKDFAYTYFIDANTGWDVNTALERLDTLSQLDIGFVEQPMRVEQDAEMVQLYQNTHIPLIADESFIGIDHMDDFQGKFHGINIKLMKCGGITAAIRMIRRARHLGFKILIGCMVESSIGISAAAQLGQWVDFLDIDGFLHLKNDPVKGISISETGKIEVPDLPGIGLSWQKSDGEWQMIGSEDYQDLDTEGSKETQSAQRPPCTSMAFKTPW